MTRTTFYLLDEELHPWRLDDEALLPWPDCRYFGQVLREVDRASPQLGLRFVLTKRLHGPLPLQGDDVVVVCLGDELSVMPGYAHDVRLVAKTYGVRRRSNLRPAPFRPLSAFSATVVQEAIVQGRRAPSFVRSQLRTVRRRYEPMVIDVPLGLYLLEDVPFQAFDDRKYDVSYAGSRTNRARETKRRVPTQKLRSRRELESVLSALAASPRDFELAVRLIGTFQDAASHSTAYSQLLMDSRVTLCPRGGSLETYRFFEALRCGCVPISEQLPDREYYSQAPGIRVRSWLELPKVLDTLLSDSDALRAAHQEVMQWWADRCSPNAIARRLLGALDAPMQGAPRRIVGGRRQRNLVR